MRQKTPKKTERVPNEKMPMRRESVLTEFPVWSFKRMDKEWMAPHDYFSSNYASGFIKTLHDLEHMSWGEIIQTYGGKKRGTNSHFIPVCDLCTGAQKRLRELQIEEDSIFSLRLQGKHRLFGLIDNGIFNIIWYDHNHAVCPMSDR